MTDLIERLEQAEAPSRELDLAVAEYVGNHSSASFPRYTASLDAALELVPEEWRIYALQQMSVSKDEWFAGLDRRMPKGGGENVVNNYAPTPVLALTIAALRAREGAT